MELPSMKLPSAHVEPLKLATAIVIALLLVKIMGRAARVVRGKLEEEGLQDLGWWVEKTLLYGSYLLAFSIVLESLGMSIWALVTGLGLAGAGIAVAARDLIANLLAGLYLALERPFEVGDRIRVGEYSGEVVDLRIRCTVLKSRGRRIVIPNSVLVNETVERLDDSDECEFEVVVEGSPNEIGRRLAALEGELDSLKLKYYDISVERVESGRALVRVRAAGKEVDSVHGAVRRALVKRPGGTDRWDDD
ncbi:mechanosensitive ion channel family protein [Methanopyrus sp. SNP6]|uniref:mechanosensitive ion channel family protein n=1 Tax=Methanopyrus sp. SNP6 TaxID=1937005 RepID=UPI0011E5C43D|nr:mechanosensitive ion channel domain-containing protein [Methanopyrus sp. SNP6]